METAVEPQFNEVPRDWGNWLVKVVRPNGPHVGRRLTSGKFRQFHFLITR